MEDMFMSLNEFMKVNGKSVGLNEEKKQTVTVSYVNNDYKERDQRAKKFKVILKDDKSSEKNLQITGDGKNIIKFLKNSGWIESDLEKWYPQLF